MGEIVKLKNKSTGELQYPTSHVNGVIVDESTNKKLSEELSEFYKKTETYSQLEIDDMLAYTLPPASTSELGGVIVGDGLIIDSEGIVQIDQIFLDNLVSVSVNNAISALNVLEIE